MTRRFSNQNRRALYGVANKSENIFNQKLQSARLAEILEIERSLRQIRPIFKFLNIEQSSHTELRSAAVFLMRQIESIVVRKENKEILDRAKNVILNFYNYEKSQASEETYPLSPELKANADHREISDGEARNLLSYTYTAQHLSEALQKLYAKKQKLPTEKIIENPIEFLGVSLHLNANALPLLAHTLDLNPEQYYAFVLNCAKQGILFISERRGVLNAMTESFSPDQWEVVQQEVNRSEFERIAKEQSCIATETLCNRKSAILLQEQINQDAFYLMGDDHWKMISLLSNLPKKFRSINFLSDELKPLIAEEIAKAAAESATAGAAAAATDVVTNFAGHKLPDVFSGFDQTFSVHNPISTDAKSPTAISEPPFRRRARSNSIRLSTTSPDQSFLPPSILLHAIEEAHEDAGAAASSQKPQEIVSPKVATELSKRGQEDEVTM